MAAAHAFFEPRTSAAGRRLRSIRAATFRAPSTAPAIGSGKGSRRRAGAEGRPMRHGETCQQTSRERMGTMGSSPASERPLASTLGTVVGRPPSAIDAGGLEPPWGLTEGVRVLVAPRDESAARALVGEAQGNDE
jgi:hypothetical protein